MKKSGDLSEEKRLLNVMGNVDERYIHEAASYEKEPDQREKHSYWEEVVVAACICIVGVLIFGSRLAGVGRKNDGGGDWTSTETGQQREETSTMDIYTFYEKIMGRINNIDISEISPELIVKQPISMSMQEMPAIHEMTQKAAIIFRGKLIRMQSYMNNDNLEVCSYCTFLVQEIYKGSDAKIIRINAPCGIMKASQLRTILHEKYEIPELTKEDDGTYAAYGLADPMADDPMPEDIVMPWDIDTEFIIFAGEKGEDGNYSLCSYWGIFAKTENGDFACCMPNSGLENITDPVEQLAKWQQTSEDRQMQGGQQTSEDQQTAVSQSSETAEQPTGYPRDELQESYVFAAGSLYSFWAGREYTMTEEEITERYPGYSLYGSVKEQNDKEKPTEELTSSHVPPDSRVYCNPQDTDTVIVYYDGKAYFFTKAE